jgi:hypothetical protein
MAGFVGIIIAGSITIILLAIQVFNKNRVPIWMFGVIVALFVLSVVFQYADFKNQEKQQAFIAGYADLNPKKIGITSFMPVELEFGTNRVVAQQQASILGVGAVVIEGMDPLNVWLEDGQLKVNAIVRDSTGRVVARIDANQFRRTDNSGQYDFNFDRQALEIINSENLVVLQIQLDGSTAQVKGIFYGPSGQSCIIDNDAMLVNPINKNFIPNIQMIFKHPGIRYIGERVVQK